MTLELSPDELLTTTRAVRKRLDLTRPVERHLIDVADTPPLPNLTPAPADPCLEPRQPGTTPAVIRPTFYRYRRQIRAPARGAERLSIERLLIADQPDAASETTTEDRRLEGPSCYRNPHRGSTPRARPRYRNQAPISASDNEYCQSGSTVRRPRAARTASAWSRPLLAAPPESRARARGQAPGSWARTRR